MCRHQAPWKLPKLWDFLVELHKTDPQAFEADGGYLRAIVAQRWKALEDGTHCPNCRASMAQYERTPSYHHACLLRSMARKVDQRTRAGVDFTEANKVHVQKDLDDDYTTKGTTAICRQLGLIAMIRKEDGSHDTKAGWAITKRGFAFLRNEPVPRSVITFRNEIIERSEETITISEIFNSNEDFDYDAREYIQIVGMAKGVL